MGMEHGEVPLLSESAHDMHSKTRIGKFLFECYLAAYSPAHGVLLVPVMPSTALPYHKSIPYEYDISFFEATQVLRHGG